VKSQRGQRTQRSWSTKKTQPQTIVGQRRARQRPCSRSLPRETSKPRNDAAGRCGSQDRFSGFAAARLPFLNDKPHHPTSPRPSTAFCLILRSTSFGRASCLALASSPCATGRRLVLSAPAPDWLEREPQAGATDSGGGRVLQRPLALARGRRSRAATDRESF